jgi:two-component system chemotaxis response regulator CheY
MIVYTEQNYTQLLSLVLSIKSNVAEWQIIQLTLTKACSLSNKEVADKLYQIYSSHEGDIFVTKENKVICLVRLGNIEDYMKIKEDLENKMPEQSCRVVIEKVTLAGIKTVQIELLDRIRDSNKKNGKSNLKLFRDRLKREDNVFLVVDDDELVRKFASKILGYHGDVLEIADGADVIEKYVEHNPDMILLDLHMPGKNGWDLIDEIIELDNDAFIVIFSADSVADNVMIAVQRGAAGVISKPPRKEKIKSYLNRCVTFTE